MDQWRLAQSIAWDYDRKLQEWKIEERRRSAGGEKLAVEAQICYLHLSGLVEQPISTIPPGFHTRPSDAAFLAKLTALFGLE